MGREFVLQLDRDQQFDEIWVLARRREVLEALGQNTRAKIRAIPCDLTKPDNIEAYASLLDEIKPCVSVLVNAGGFGQFGAFVDIPLETQLEMIDLNDKALVSMTYRTLPYMSFGSVIYQLGSLSAFQPVPYIGVYGASKAFVMSFSRSLNVELKKLGIKVMAVCPGWVKTEFFDRAENERSVGPRKKKPLLTVEYAVSCAMRAMKKGKILCTCNWFTKMQHLFSKILPNCIPIAIWRGMLKK